MSTLEKALRLGTPVWASQYLYEKEAGRFLGFATVTRSTLLSTGRPLQLPVREPAMAPGGLQGLLLMPLVRLHMVFHQGYLCENWGWWGVGQEEGGEERGEGERE